MGQRPNGPSLLPGPCDKHCPNRCADPNCHDPERCEKWAEYVQQKAERQKAMKKNPEDTYRKMVGFRARAASAVSRKNNNK